MIVCKTLNGAAQQVRELLPYAKGREQIARGLFQSPRLRGRGAATQRRFFTGRRGARNRFLTKTRAALQQRPNHKIFGRSFHVDEFQNLNLVAARFQKLGADRVGHKRGKALAENSMP